ncbi:hypothetical protein BUALT_Bualt04G0161300 [Buddleja alternifolia]|uniref:Cytochrome c oxidase subunit 5C n=1 Tax=Buddleja alternifolia TaxID=168488 RepID=A0AAV6Y052_9LAMI|nr:hypothetical protein BUALT_Bualt04G0161300 [Buddleja alternifolia]
MTHYYSLIIIVHFITRNPSVFFPSGLFVSVRISSAYINIALGSRKLINSTKLQSQVFFQERMAAHVVYKGPSIIKEILIGIGLGLVAGGLWKMHHWNNQRRTKEFYDLLDRGEISVVRENE